MTNSKRGFVFLENRKLIYTIISTVVLLAVVVTAVYSLIKNGVFADTAKNYYDQIKISNDINGDGKDEQLSINVLKEADKYKFNLEILKGKNSLANLELSGFESNISFCPDPVLNINSVKTICIQGFVGVHAENIQLIKYTNALSLLRFSQDGRLLDNIVTDAPNFNFEKESSEIRGIYLDNRNYAKDPVVDIIRSHYYLSDGELVFKNNEELKMAEPTNDKSDGKIN